MIQLFDTHRLSYRNAKLRAWALADKTRRVNFQDYSSEDDEWTSVGTDVITDESGYLFYANGTQKIECLGVEEAAIVDVSLDGGQSYLIQFVIHADHDPTALRADDIYGLTFTNDNGVDEVYNPTLGPSRLPDYLRRSEYSQGDWREQTIITQSDDIDGSAITITDYTHLIIIKAGRADGSGLLTFTLPDNRALRNGQVITIYSRQDIGLSFNTVDSPSEQYKVQTNHVYVLNNNVAKNKLILTDVTATNGFAIANYVNTSMSAAYFFDFEDVRWDTATVQFDITTSTATDNHITMIWLKHVPNRPIDFVVRCRNIAIAKIQIGFYDESPTYLYEMTFTPSATYVTQGCRLVQTPYAHTIIG